MNDETPVYVGAALGLVALVGGGVALATVLRGTHGGRAPMAQLRFWPIAMRDLVKIGDRLMADRNGRPHNGVDLYAPAGTVVRAPTQSRVIRVIRGGDGDTESLRRAGLWVDLGASDGTILRALHLGRALVEPGQAVQAGEPIGLIGAQGITSGVRDSDPHLHFEVREHDFRRGTGYGPPLDPLLWLPRQAREPLT